MREAKQLGQLEYFVFCFFPFDILVDGGLDLRSVIWRPEGEVEVMGIGGCWAGGALAWP